MPPPAPLDRLTDLACLPPVLIQTNRAGEATPEAIERAFQENLSRHGDCYLAANRDRAGD